MLGTSSFGYEICKKTNTYIDSFEFKKSVNGTLTNTDNTNKTWGVSYDYAKLTGKASCNAISGNPNVMQSKLVTKYTDKGIYCWCQMYPIDAFNPTTPISSYWVMLSTYATRDECASSCTTACGNAMASDQAFRTVIFTSIW